MRKDIGTFVVYACIKDTHGAKTLYPSERYIEVISCKNEHSKTEKYSVWKLLERVVTDKLKMNFENIEFTKTANGKWICPDFCFSLSHTCGAVCVALSPCDVGVDIERMRPIREELASKILTESEKTVFDSLEKSERCGYLLEAWVKKESIFKMTGGKALMPNRTDASDYSTVTRRARIENEEYVISVATSDGEDRIEFIYLEEI